MGVFVTHGEEYTRVLVRIEAFRVASNCRFKYTMHTLVAKPTYGKGSSYAVDSALLINS